MRKMALVCWNDRNLSTLRNISDRYGASHFTLNHIGRFEDAKLRKEALGSKLQWLFWTGSPYIRTAIEK